MLYHKRFIEYFAVIWRLGIFNVAYIVWYRFTLRFGIRKLFFSQYPYIEDGPFFMPCGQCTDYADELKKALLEAADCIIHGEIRYYAYHWKPVGNPPDWFANPFNKKIFPDPQSHWTEINDFNSIIGDIKNIWEASRFDWAVTLARAYAVSGKSVYLNTLNKWLRDWTDKNPVNTGPNWKCGQEASIRVFNLINTALILKQWLQPSKVLKELIYRHIERISANIRYAIVQDNNHGTSEAAALFIGGHWLAHADPLNPRSKRFYHYALQGRKWLENRIKRLVEFDGSFSQHSVTYHRVLLDTLVFVEYYRRKFDATPFSKIFYNRINAAIHWLFMMTDQLSGNAPNLGANDGAMLLNAHCCDYRDFRPSLQTSSLVFNDKKIFERGPWDEPGYWFDLNNHKVVVPGIKKTSEEFQGGYIVMIGKESWGMMRFPFYRFRPAHADALHVDLWYKGKNILRDGGSYSYNYDEPWQSYFPGTKSHNTMEFDDSDQMLRLSRFLWGKWIKGKIIKSLKDDGGSIFWTGEYIDFKDCRHQRAITMKNDCWFINDLISGYKGHAILRWRLLPGEWKLEGNICRDGDISIEINSDRGFEIKLADGWESEYYMQKSELPVVEVMIKGSQAEINTVIKFQFKS